MKNFDKDCLIVDLDNTITIHDIDNDYSQMLCNSDIKKSLDNAKKQGYVIDIFSSRNMRTYKGDEVKINKYTRPVAEKWLKKNNIVFDNLILGKPWCGPDGWYIDDKNLSIEEFLIKFNGLYSKLKFSVVIPFFNEESNCIKVYEETKKIERILNIDEYIFVNNGSTDNSLMELTNISKLDKKVKILNIEINIGYGNGMKRGIEFAKNDSIITNHADLQFNPYSFFLSHSELLMDANSTPKNIFPVRKNRSSINIFYTYILRKVLAIVLFKKINEFNGQPKVLLNKRDYDFDNFSDNFSFDLNLWLETDKNMILDLPILERDRFSGESSWNNTLLNKLKVFFGYIKFAFLYRGKR